MRKAVYKLVRSTPPALVYAVFVLLLMLAMAPLCRVLLFGLSMDELLKLRCLAPV
ncbi:hypothetical protein [Bradyrhizobium glycinis]|uniref:hypothetical protein n=1 Tax=Bradyrhizobium glycinis TaxID=2751812 RepID=UPI0018D85AFF|nr:hypothetical protein [Bradyrhizobium glycinis]MBH5370549.1 hypothetical protein [Bradyrhizobium glycinis]